MCLILLAYHCHPRYPLLVAANRDEFYQRPTRNAGFWPEDPQLLAGRDLEAGGTWLGLHQQGRFAAITNYRGSTTASNSNRSRGHLPLDFLRGQLGARDYAGQLTDHAQEYAGFNLLLMDGGELVYYSNIQGQPRALPPGVYGLSNALLDTPWPKVERGRRQLQERLEQPEVSPEQLTEVVASAEFAPDEELPDTGIGLAAERWLSAQFIHAGDYGTRATTALTIDSEGQVAFLERTFDTGGKPSGQQQLEFRVASDRQDPAVRE